MTMDNRKSIILHFILCFFLLSESVQSLTQSPPEKELSDILKQLKTYEQGENDNLILELNSCIRSHKASEQGKLECEQQLISFLRKEATASGKMEACRHLRIIGTQKSVPILEEMLLKSETSDMARYALEKIPGAASDKALLQGLKKSNGLIKAGIVSSLGHRKVPEAIPYLEEMLNNNTDSYLSLASASALGHIKNPPATEMLLKAFLRTSGKLKTQITGSLLKCAEEYLSKGNSEKAQMIYDQILNSDLPFSLHNSAFKGKIKTSGPKATQLILETLKNKEKNIYPCCIEMIPEYFDATRISQITALLPTLPNSSKIPLISVLSLYPEKEVLQSVLESTHSSAQEVRLASLKTLKQIGTSSTVDFLAQYAARSKGKEQQQARSSLWGLKGINIDKTIISNLNSEKNPEIQIEYIKAVEERRIYPGKEALINKLSSPIPKISIRATKSIKEISSPEDIPKLIEFLLKTENHQNREELIHTIAFTALKIQNPLERGDMVIKALPEAKDPLSRTSMYLLLGRIGDDSTLPVLRKGLSDPNEIIQDAVVRAFSSWPTPTASDDVLHLAHATDKPDHQILCLRSYIKMIEMEPYRKPEAAVQSLETALNLAQRNSEKIMILGVLPKFPCDQAAELAQRLTQNKDIQQEAKKALSLIKEKMKNKN
ncbi:MAG: HEAT repeat domain-containing protein [Acidobacteriota bacterium]